MLSQLASAAAINKDQIALASQTSSVAFDAENPSSSVEVKPLTYENLLDYTIPHDDDDEPMIYSIPIDFAAFAREERERLIADGASPDAVVFEYQVADYVPHVKGETPEEYAARYVHTYNDMMERGLVVEFYKGWAAEEVWPQQETPDGRVFDLGPETGITRGEFREISEWFEREWEQLWEMREGEGAVEWGTPFFDAIPEKWLRFERVRQEDDEGEWSEKAS